MDTIRSLEIIVESSDKPRVWTMNSPALQSWRRIHRSGGEVIGTAPVKVNMCVELCHLSKERKVLHYEFFLARPSQ